MPNAPSLPKVGQYEFKLFNFQLGYHNRLAFTKMIDYMLESAGFHAEERGLGKDFVMKTGRTWIIIRFTIKIDRYLHRQKNLKVETWIEGAKGLFSDRKFNLLDDEGNIWGSACVTWALMDLKTRRLQQLDGVVPEEYVVENKASLVGRPGKVPSITKELTPAESFRVKYNDLDFNKHVYSGRYIQWMIDAFPVEFLVQKEIKAIEINFMSELVGGEMIDVFVDELEKDKTFLIELKNDGKAVCRGKVTFGATDYTD